MQTMPALPQPEEEGKAVTAGKARPQLPALRKQQPGFQHCCYLQTRPTAVNNTPLSCHPVHKHQSSNGGQKVVIQLSNIQMHGALS